MSQKNEYNLTEIGPDALTTSFDLCAPLREEVALM